ncbi:MAG: aromatic ring-hydroxylating dioxygenase subunit alpha [Gammaproteobacteria bacterium]|nr:aromatic ring-hydroxylating dioxygenase subunit alpha [Gammaproteobacteria bacterium]
MATNRPRELDAPVYVRNAWYVACWDYELHSRDLLSRTLINQPVLLYRREDGAPVAMADQCCHRLAPLSRGRREGDDIRCMYHGLKFNDEGQCIDIPGQSDIPAQFRVHRFPVVIAHSWVWVWMGDPELADEALIPTSMSLSNDAFALRPGFLDYRANYQLINDNLTDFSHLAYTHEHTFARGRDDLARETPTIEALERGVRISRWVEATVGGGNYGSGAASAGLVDTWMSYDYLVPGILLMHSKVFPAGTAQRCNLGVPDGEPLHASFTAQAVTPMTDDTTRYFYSWGPRTSEHQANPQLVLDMLALAKAAFEEDRLMIEAQQRSIKLNPDAPINTIVHDRAPLMMRRIIEHLAARDIS